MPEQAQYNPRYDLNSNHSYVPYTEWSIDYTNLPDLERLRFMTSFTHETLELFVGLFAHKSHDFAAPSTQCFELREELLRQATSAKNLTTQGMGRLWELQKVYKDNIPKIREISRLVQSLQKLNDAAQSVLREISRAPVTESPSQASGGSAEPQVKIEVDEDF